MSNLIEFIVPGTPVGKGRPRVSTRGGKFARMYTPPKTVSYESLVALAASQAMAGKPLFEVPVKVDLLICLPVPASWSKCKQEAALAGEVWPTKKPDIDNVVKAIFDSINGIVWRDDAQVCKVIIVKQYGPRAGAAVTVKPLGAAREEEF